MLLEITKTLALDRPPSEVWAFLLTPERVAACIPNVQDFRPASSADHFTAVIADRLGPFKLQVPVMIDISRDLEARQIHARIAGDDGAGQARVRGELTATLQGEGDRSGLVLASRVEVLGRMAALGAVPMRRRADQVFDVFAQNLRAALAPRAAWRTGEPEARNG